MTQEEYNQNIKLRDNKIKLIYQKILFDLISSEIICNKCSTIDTSKKYYCEDCVEKLIDIACERKEI